jgi:hypothetical protein
MPKVYSENDNFMLLENAIEIVYNLAEQNALSKDNAETPELLNEYYKQQVALRVVHDFIVNHIAE